MLGEVYNIYLKVLINKYNMVYEEFNYWSFLKELEPKKCLKTFIYRCLENYPNMEVYKKDLTDKNGYIINLFWKKNKIIAEETFNKFYDALFDEMKRCGKEYLDFLEKLNKMADMYGSSAFPSRGRGTAVAVDEVECPSAEPCAMTLVRNDEGIVPYM